MQLPTVTLCAASSVNVRASIEALLACSNQISFAECLLFTDSQQPAPAPIRVIPIESLSTAEAYSNFLLHKLVGHIRAPHCLVVQWDGFVIKPTRWDPRFLDFDYIGAPWPQFHDGHEVGNGGFSLRSRRLLEACVDPEFLPAIQKTSRSAQRTGHFWNGCIGYALRI